MFHRQIHIFLLVFLLFMRMSYCHIVLILQYDKRPSTSYAYAYIYNTILHISNWLYKLPRKVVWCIDPLE